MIFSSCNKHLFLSLSKGLLTVSVIAVLLTVLFSGSATAIKQRPDSGGDTSQGSAEEEGLGKSGTLITIERLEGKEPETATGTEIIHAATDTAAIDSATPTATATATRAVQAASSTESPDFVTITGSAQLDVGESASATPTMVIDMAEEETVAQKPETAEKPAGEKAEAPEKPQPAGDVPEAQKSTRYKSKIEGTAAVQEDTKAGQAPEEEKTAGEKEPEQEKQAVQQGVEKPETPKETPPAEPPAAKDEAGEAVAKPTAGEKAKEAAAAAGKIVDEAVAEKEQKQKPAQPEKETTKAAAPETVEKKESKPAPAEVEKPDGGKKEPRPGAEEPATVAEKSPEPKEHAAKPPPEKVEPAPAQQPPPAAGPPVYIVRSRPFVDKNEKDALEALLLDHDYHPSVVEQKLPGRDAQYIVEMGRFDSMHHAVGLLLQVKELTDEFFIVRSGGSQKESASATAGGLFSGGGLQDVFPGRGGGNDTDVIELLGDIPELEPPAPLPMTGLERENAVAKLQRQKAPKMIEDFNEAEGIVKSSPRPGPPVASGGKVQPAPLKNRIRDIAWEMRERGFGVYLEKESFKHPEGIMVGVFDSREGAKELAEELVGYGYAVNVIHEVYGDGRFYVYADPENTTRGITFIDPDKIEEHRVTNEFNPPPDPLADPLLNMIPGKEQ